jgi:ElaB/YqjD/DUF883 family membrane-anchored ribosome-binding protein
MYHYTRRLYPGALHTRAGGIEFALSRGRDQIFQCYTVAGSKTQTVRKGREMASIHELQKTDTPMADAQSHDKPQTLSTQIQNAGTQVKETVQAAGTQVKETVQDMGTYVKETAQNVGTQVKETVQDMGAQAKETMQAAGTQVYEQGRESLQDLNRTIEGQIRQRPLQALLVAGGIGVLFGILWQRS